MLLILATVAISMAVDSNGLFARARKAAEDWNKSVGDESTAIENAMLILNKIDGGSTSGGGTEPPPVEEKDTEPPTGSHTLSSEIVKKGEKATLTVTGEDNVGVKQIKKPDGTTQEGKTATYEIETTGEYKFEIEDEAGNKTPYTAKVRIAILPEGYVASSVEGEDSIENGLVIYEEGTEAEKKGPVTSENHATALTGRNQYVWIPVDNINSMVMCQDCGATGTLTFNANDNTLQCNNSTTHGNATKLAGKLYATSTGNNFNAGLTGQTYTQNSGLREPDHLTDASHGDASAKGIAAIKGILEKVNPGKSYEATYDSIKTDWLALQQKDFDEMAKSVAKYKGFYISRYEIQAGAASKKGADVLNAGSSSANMWYGLYTTMQNSNSPEKSTVAQMIWGSQYDQVMMFALEKARTDGTGAAFDVKTASATRKRSRGQVSGNSPADLVCNIYDLENNYREWTAEADGTDYRVPRGRRLHLQRFRIVP